MHDLILGISMIIFILFIVGLFAPGRSLFWYNGERTRKRSALIYLPTFFILGIIAQALTPQSYLDEKKRKEEEFARIKEAEEEEKKKNAVYRIDNCNHFKDYTSEYKGLKIQDKFKYGTSFLLKDLISKTKTYTKKKTILLSMYHYDEKVNRCDVVVELPVDMDVPNITNIGEEVLLTFICNEGSLNSGNTVLSMTRFEE